MAYLRTSCIIVCLTSAIFFFSGRHGVWQAQCIVEAKCGQRPLCGSYTPTPKHCMRETEPPRTPWGTPTRASSINPPGRHYSLSRNDDTEQKTEEGKPKQKGPPRHRGAPKPQIHPASQTNRHPNGLPRAAQGPPKQPQGALEGIWDKCANSV